MNHHFVAKEGSETNEPKPVGKDGSFLCLLCGSLIQQSMAKGPCPKAVAAPTTDEPFDYGPIPCPTCRSVGTQPCIRGRYPSPIWERQEVLPEGHSSRVKVNNQ